MSEYGLNMIDFILTHLDHYCGPSQWFDALKSVPGVVFGRFQNASTCHKIDYFQAFWKRPKYNTVTDFSASNQYWEPK